MKNGATGPAAEWIAADWGSSRLRVWAMTDEDEEIGRAESDAGAAGLERDAFEPALLALIEPWLGPGLRSGRTLVLASGMIGARGGWAEAPYLACPCEPFDGAAAATADALDERLSIRILPGVSQAKPADVMRGEETQIAGFLAAEPTFDGVVLLPGTHAKWAHVSAGEIVSFRTFMTGEIFALMAARSVLRHSVAQTDQGDMDEAAFAEAVSDALSKPESMAARLFSIRAESLLEAPAPGAARARLSGFLIGMELAAARPYWLGRDVVIIGAAGLAGRYDAALRAQGLAPRRASAEDTALGGLTAARAIIGRTT